MQWSINTILVSDSLHILWGLLWLAPFSLILTIFSPRFKGRGATTIIFLLFLVAASELHVWADLKNLKLLGLPY